MRALRYEVGYITHPGNQRPVNQDSLLIRRGSVDNREFLLLAVADGMGGMAQGEEASGLATRRLDQWWTEQLPSLVSPRMDWEAVESSLRVVVEAVNWTLYSAAQEGTRSGTTLTLLFLFQGEYRIFQVGDSRAYLLQKGSLRQLTRDQTYCRREIEAGRMTEAEAAVHPMRHVLVSTLGVTNEYTLEVTAGKLPNGGSILLCSDGFYQELPAGWPGPNRERHSVQTVLEEAASLILRGTAEDNLTALLVRMTRSWRR